MISIRKCWEACCQPEISNFFASAVVLHHQLYQSPSELPVTSWMLTPRVFPTPCTSGMDGTCCRLILLHRSKLRFGSHTLGQTCSPEYQYPQKTTRKWLNAECMRSHSLTAGKRGWESCTDASQQGSTAEPQHCWAGSINRITNTLSREVQKRDERPGGSAFQHPVKTGKAVSLHDVHWGARFTSLKTSTKSSVDFPSDTRLALGKLPDDYRQHWIWIYFSFDAFL